MPAILPRATHAHDTTSGSFGTTYRRVGARVALRFADPEGRSDEAGRVIPHAAVVLPPLAFGIRSVDDGQRTIWPLIADAFKTLWELERPPWLPTEPSVTIQLGWAAAKSADRQPALATSDRIRPSIRATRAIRAPLQRREPIVVPRNLPVRRLNQIHTADVGELDQVEEDASELLRDRATRPGSANFS